mmetsp:Transcript_99036/g.263163  ORF Transcript_99036/g.263163 Transcript_99036/m.263163 type:complete len:218 (-) Transcript_99036:1052-1705(-)
MDEGSVLGHGQPTHPWSETLQAGGVLLRPLHLVARPRDDDEVELRQQQVASDDGLLVLRVARLPAPVPGPPRCQVSLWLQPVRPNHKGKLARRVHVLQLTKQVVGEQRLPFKALHIANVDAEAGGKHLIHRDLAHAEPVQRIRLDALLVWPRVGPWAARHNPDLVRAAAVEDVGRHCQVLVRDGVKGTPEDRYAPVPPLDAVIHKIVEAVSADVGQD